MNKSELIEAVANKTKQAKKDTGETLNALLEVIEAQVKKGDKIVLAGFGSFESVKRAARDGTNPKTGAAIKIPAKKVAKAKLTFKV